MLVHRAENAGEEERHLSGAFLNALTEGAGLGGADCTLHMAARGTASASGAGAAAPESCGKKQVR